MDKQTIINRLTENYASFASYINSLTEEEYTYSNGHKWTAAEQAEHLVLCVKPLVQVLNMDKTAIAHTFGTTSSPNRSYEALVDEYIVKLNEGGKAPERFVPKEDATMPKEVICTKLMNLIHDLCVSLQTFSEEDLDTLQIPHPLLGNLAMREMLYNAIYHVLHHQKQVQENLKTINA